MNHSMAKHVVLLTESLPTMWTEKREFLVVSPVVFKGNMIMEALATFFAGVLIRAWSRMHSIQMNKDIVFGGTLEDLATFWTHFAIRCVMTNNSLRLLM